MYYSGRGKVSDIKSKSHLYLEIAKEIKKNIQQGNYLPGDPIPSENQLSKEFEASRVTIRKAIDNLVEMNLVEKRHGSGTYVKEKAYKHELYSLKSFTEDMESVGKEVRSEILRYEIMEAPKKVAIQLKIVEKTKIYFIRRKRLANENALVVEDTYLPIELFPDLTYETMLHSKYEFIESHPEYKIKESQQLFLPILPGTDIKEILDIEDNVPILKLESTGILTNGIHFEYSEVYFKSEDYDFTITAKRDV